MAFQEYCTKEVATVPIILVGLNHRTTPVKLREQLSLCGDKLLTSVKALSCYRLVEYSGDATPVCENVVLSTCNRLEVYAWVENAASGWTTIQSFLAQRHGLSLDHLSPHLYFLEGEAAITHLFRVASGLDSMILGEPQILGQVSRALGTSQDAKAVGPVLSRLFMQASHAGKKARSETAISRHTTSISHAAVLLAREQVDDIRRVRALVVGAGEMGALAAEALHMQGVKAITCINRTEASAMALARRVQGQVLNWHALPNALAWADVVITATSAPHTIIHRSDVAQVLPHRQGRPLVFVDTAMPRDVEETIDDLELVYRYDIDDLRATMDTSRAQRKAEVPAVEAIVKSEVQSFVEWLHNRQVAPIITDLRNKALALAHDEVEQALRRLEGLPERDRQVINRLAHRIVNKLLHTPTQCLKTRTASRIDQDYVQVVRDLFCLEASHLAAK
jgi:glutamyl-tRNA reductase